MSRTKSVRICGRMAWVFDNSHDIAVARMVEVGQRLGVVSDSVLHYWRVWASVPDLGFRFEPGQDVGAALAILTDVRASSIEGGDVLPSDLAEWSVLEGVNVSDGFLRRERLPAECIVDVVDGFIEMFDGRLPADPDDGWWFFGAPKGRSVIRRRGGSSGSRDDG